MKRSTAHPYDMKLIPARLIVANRGYQRDTDAAEIKSIVSNFDYHHVNPVKVTKKDGLYYAFDGQHTALALRTLFGDEYLVPCMVYYDVATVDDEAKLFEEANTKAKGKKVSQMALWKSRIFRNDPTAVTIKNICGNNGLKIATTRNSGKKYIYALNALERAYLDLDAVLFGEFIEILASAWDGEADSLTAPILKGLSRFVEVYHGKYDKTRLVKKLSRTPAIKIICAGNASVGPGAVKYAREILNIYNSNLSTQNRLPDLFA